MPSKREANDVSERACANEDFLLFRRRHEPSVFVPLATNVKRRKTPDDFSSFVLLIFSLPTVKTSARPKPNRSKGDGVFLPSSCGRISMRDWRVINGAKLISQHAASQKYKRIGCYMWMENISFFFTEPSLRLASTRKYSLQLPAPAHSMTR